MKKLLKRIASFMLVLFIIATAAFIFFTYTSTGLKSLIRFTSAYFNQSIEMQNLEGRLLDHVQIKELNYQYEQIHIKVKNADISWKINSLWKQDLTIRKFHAEVIEITQQDQLTILQNVEGSALINKENITVHSLSFNYLGINILSDLQLKAQYPYSFTSTIRLRALEQIKTLQGILNIAGDVNLIHWSGDFSGFGSISLQGTLKDLNQLQQIIKWRDLIHWPSTSKDEILSKEGRIVISGRLPDLKVELSSRINRTPEDQWQINGQIQGTLPWDWKAHLKLNQTNDKSSKNEGLYTKFDLTGELNNPYQAALNIKIAPGHYQLPADSSIKSLAFQEGIITARLSKQGVQGAGSINLYSNKKFTMKFNLPNFNLAEGFMKKQTFSAQLLLAVNSLDFLSTLIPELKNPQGILTLSLNAKGSFKKPSIETKLVLNKASVELPNLGINLHSIACTVIGKKDHWEGKGTLLSGNQPLALKGKGLLFPQPSGEISLEGANVPIMNSNEYQINVSPKLQIKYNQDLLQVLGTILIPYANIKIQSFSNSIGLSSDVVFEHKEKAPSSSPIQSQIDIQVSTGDQVELNAKGLHATLAGTVHIKQTPQSPMSATGELNVVEGEYKAYGQNLAIDQGELFFTGGAIDNPGINLRASKTIKASVDTNSTANQLLDFNSNNLQNANLRGNISVGVEVTGRLINPEIKLFSTPAILSQADILSMMVLGRPASQANKSGAQLLLAAISSMNLGNNSQGTQLLEQLKQNLGVDFNVETNSNYNLLTNTVSDKTAFVVSKSLSKRISLSYNVGLSQADPNVVTLKYLLNKFFSIQVSSSSSSSGIDVLYTSSKK
ncbi:translocation/assembly module TamB domain-containing protein [Legionella sp. km772]|uniref:translocation/assembly module TamB domain-containing protein n=1 Tax=Legionella sp. km772 TaxID=2498111 RepID=UPI000F8D1C00|nr:translocation/assembly module TamB domain-containing protein [Legionella sp. km772]RUR13901.1 DUF490 domain-containing protein [Legionella sp. km772]